MPKPIYRVYMDFEFHDQGVLDVPLDIISIGLVTEDTVDGSGELYLQNINAHWAEIARNKWLVENVLPHLQHFDMRTMRPEGLLSPGARTYEMPWVTRGAMAREVDRFFQRVVPDGHKLQLRGFFADYDHTALAGLYGKMIDLPSDRVPMWTYDIRQRVYDMEQALGREIRLPEQDGGEHNALSDARHNRRMDIFLDQMLPGSSG